MPKSVANSMTNSTLPLPPPPHLLLSNPFLASFAASCLLQNIDLATATLPPSSPLLLPKKTHTINSFNMPTCCACSHDNCQILSSFLSFPPPPPTLSLLAEKYGSYVSLYLCLSTSSVDCFLLPHIFGAYIFKRILTVKSIV